MRQRMELLPSESIPYFSTEIRGTGSGEGCASGESRRPNGAFMPDEGSDPVAGQTVAEHGVVVFTSGDEVVLGVCGGIVGRGLEGGEGKVGYWSGMAVAG